MGFSLLSDGAEPPPWPHIICAGSGYAWHDDEDRRACYVGEVGVDAPVVAAAIDGRDLPGVDRLLAVARMREEAPGSIIRAFRVSCPVKGCGGNHLERAERAMRALKRYVHPEAIDALRIARVSERILCEPRIRRKGTEERDRKGAKRDRLPVWVGDPERTRIAQIAFASQYAAKRSR